MAGSGSFPYVRDTEVSVCSLDGHIPDGRSRSRLRFPVLRGMAKGATASREIAGANSRGLLFCRLVAPCEPRLIGTEFNALEVTEAQQMVTQRAKTG